MIQKSCSALLLALASAFAYGQATAPALMTGQMPSSDFHASGDLKNVFIGSLFAGGTFDDNIQNLSANRKPGGMYYFGSKTALQITRQHVKWDLSYQPSVSLASHGVLNQFSQGLNQAFGTTLEVSPDQKLSFRLRQDYLVTTDPFQQLGQNTLESPIGLLDRPNNSVVLPQLKRTSLLSEATVGYRLAAQTTVGVGGTYAVQKYSDVVGGSSLYSPLLNSRSPSGYVYVSHEWSPRQTSGAEYRYSQFDFAGIDQRTKAQSVLLFDQIRLSAHHNLTLFAGPQYAEMNGQFTAGLPITSTIPSVHQRSLSPAAGLVYSFATRRNMFQASYVRQVSEGGGFLPTVRMSSESVSIGRRLTREWTFNLSAALSDNSVLGVSRPFRYRSVSGSAGFSRNIRNSVFLSIGYQRLQQTSNAVFGALGNHNQATVSMGYSFTKPLGR